jgi:DNA modification methylase
MLYYGQDCRKSFRQLPAGSVHTICTSPPYWGLRNYGNDPSVWGGDESCDHEWGEGTDESGKTCAKCDAWLGQLGLEPKPEMFVDHLVEIFREARRVLQDDGVLWVNLGDSYANDGKWGGSTGGMHPKDLHGDTGIGRGKRSTGLKPKDLVGIPWMTAFALRADGWYFRQDIVWAKANVMPESVFDRCTRSHEFVFMFTKKQMYYYDYYAIREDSITKIGVHKLAAKAAHRLSYQNADGTPRGAETWNNTEGKRNKRSVWNVNPKPYAGAHFAVWPEKLVEPMILAGSSEHGCCSKCKAPYERVIDRPIAEDPGRGDQSQYVMNKDVLSDRSASSAHRMLGSDYQAQINANPPTTKGWEPTCNCGAEIERCIVLDPFSGSATTGLVAMKNGRDYIGFDANAVYLDLAQARLENRAAPNIQATPDEGSADGDDHVMDLFGG